MKFTQIFVILMLFKTAYVHTNGMQGGDSFRDKGSCEKDWNQFGAHCYKFEGGPLGTSLSWRGASARCSELGGYLASIHSKEENDFLLNSYGIKNGLYAWIGLNAPGDTSKYQWDDGSHIDFKNWARDEPNPIREEQNLYCALMVDDHLFGEPGEWVDWICEHFEPFICKKKIQTEYVSQRNHPKLIPVEHEFPTTTMKTTTPRTIQEESTRSRNRMEIKTPESQGEITSTSNTFQTESVSERKHFNTVLVDHEFSTSTMKTTTPGKNQEESARTRNRIEIKSSENQGEITSKSNTCRNKNTALLSAFLNMLLLFILFR